MERDEQMADTEINQSENVGGSPTTLRSTAQDAEMEHQEEIEEHDRETSKRRLRTAERPPPITRSHETENDMMGEENKHRRIQDDADIRQPEPWGRNH